MKALVFIQVAIILFLANPASAQIHYSASMGIALSGDYGCSSIISTPVSQKFEIGLGAQLWRYQPFELSKPYHNKTYFYKPSIYADIRRTINIRQNAIHIFGQLGYTFYRNDFYYAEPAYEYKSTLSNALYSGLGVAYYQHLKTVSIKPFIALRFMGISYTNKEILNNYDRQTTLTNDGYFIAEIGVKF